MVMSKGRKRLSYERKIGLTGETCIVESHDGAKDLFEARAEATDPRDMRLLLVCVITQRHEWVE